MAINIPFKSGGELIQIMPVKIARSSDLFMKLTATTQEDSAGANFWTTGMANSHTDLGFESVFITSTLDTTEQTIVDLASQSGILTQVISPVMSAAADTATIRVTADGKVFTFIATATASNAHRGVIGYFFPFGTSITSGNPTGNAGPLDSGYVDETAVFKLAMPTPNQTIEETNIGIPYAESLKVTIQLSANAFNSGQGLKAGLAHLNYTPQEFS